MRTRERGQGKSLTPFSKEVIKHLLHPGMNFDDFLKLTSRYLENFTFGHGLDTGFVYRRRRFNEFGYPASRDQGCFHDGRAGAQATG